MKINTVSELLKKFYPLSRFAEIQAKLFACL
jgi:hypothetical protein